MSILDDIGRSGLSTCLVGHIVVKIVDAIEFIPVNLPYALVVLPEPCVELFGAFVGDVARQITVVHRAGVSCVKPVECAGSIERLVEGKTGIQCSVAVRRPNPVEDGCRVVGLYYTRVALFAVLPAPVGIIQVGASRS